MNNYTNIISMCHNLYQINICILFNMFGFYAVKKEHFVT